MINKNKLKIGVEAEVGRSSLRNAVWRDLAVALLSKEQGLGAGAIVGWKCFCVMHTASSTAWFADLILEIDRCFRINVLRRVEEFLVPEFRRAWCRRGHAKVQ